VSYQNAKEAAATWLATAGLPEDLHGRIFHLVTFATEEDCRFFYPRRALVWQQMVNTAIAKKIRGRKVKICMIALTGVWKSLCTIGSSRRHDWRRRFAHCPAREIKADRQGILPGFAT
jgi:hypothetical protein